MFKKKYRLINKNGKFILQRNFMLFWWITFGEYDNIVKAQIILNGMLNDYNNKQAQIKIQSK